MQDKWRARGEYPEFCVDANVLIGMSKRDPQLMRLKKADEAGVVESITTDHTALEVKICCGKTHT